MRPATGQDVPALLGFGEQLRDQLLPSAGEGGRPLGAAARAQLEARYLEAVADPDRHLVVVVDEDDQLLGTALLTVGPTSALLDVPAVHMTHAVVARRHERRGAGRALVAAAAAHAEAHGVEHVVTSVHPGSREANRFFARLGFAPVAVRRMAPVAVLRRRLAQGEGVLDRPVDHLVRRRPRRSLRPTPVRLGPADPALEDQPG